MEKSFIKPCLILAIILSTIFIPVLSNAQVKGNHDILFKIFNFKKVYVLSDTVKMSIENISNKPLYYVIGRDIFDSDSTWIEFQQDIKNRDLEDIPPTSEVLLPHQPKIIIFRPERQKHPPIKAHGTSAPSHFFVKYFYVTKDGHIPASMKKMTSDVFSYKW
jgi:hypothetical protein